MCAQVTLRAGNLGQRGGIWGLWTRGALVYTRQRCACMRCADACMRCACARVCVYAMCTCACMRVCVYACICGGACLSGPAHQVDHVARRVAVGRGSGCLRLGRLLGVRACSLGRGGPCCTLGRGGCRGVRSTRVSEGSGRGSILGCVRGAGVGGGRPGWGRGPDAHVPRPSEPHDLLEHQGTHTALELHGGHAGWGHSAAWGCVGTGVELVHNQGNSRTPTLLHILRI
jgi:hypothetical protein